MINKIIEEKKFIPSLTSRNNFKFSSNTVKDISVKPAIQSWSEMECYQLSSGHDIAEINVLELKSIKIVYEYYLATVQKIGSTPKNLCILLYCNLIPKFRFSTLKKNSEDTLYFLPEMSEYDIFIPKGAKTTYIILDQKNFLEDISVFNPVFLESKPEELFSFESENKIILRKVLNLWLKRAKNTNTSKILLGETFIDEFLLMSVLKNITLTSKNITLSSSEKTCAFHTYKMARNFIKDQLNIDIIPSISYICQSIGVSERTLQYAFHSYVNMTPTAYLRLCRLHCVRKTLRNSDPKKTTVTHIAMHFGFYHLGRFSLNYKEIFSESPSVTLKN